MVTPAAPQPAVRHSPPLHRRSDSYAPLACWDVLLLAGLRSPGFSHFRVVSSGDGFVLPPCECRPLYRGSVPPSLSRYGASDWTCLPPWPGWWASSPVPLTLPLGPVLMGGIFLWFLGSRVGFCSLTRGLDRAGSLMFSIGSIGDGLHAFMSAYGITFHLAHQLLEIISVLQALE